MCKWILPSGSQILTSSEPELRYIESIDLEESIEKLNLRTLARKTFLMNSHLVHFVGAF